MKFAKHLKRTALMAVFIAAAGSANAGIKLGDSTSLDLTVDAMATWVDNLYYSSGHREAAVSTSVTPGVTITHDAINNFKFGFWESFVNYLSHTELDSQLTTVNFSYDFEPRKVVGAEEGTTGSSRLHLSAHAGLTQIAQNDNTFIESGEAFSTVIRQDMYSAGVNGSYGLTSLINMSTGLSYGYHHFASLRGRYNDSQSFSVPLTLFYKLPGDRYEVGLTYSWGYTLIEANQEQRRLAINPGTQTTHNAGFSFRGSVPGTAKMTMHGNVTYGFRSIDDRVTYGVRGSGYSDATLNYNVGVSYQVRDNVHTSLNSGRNFDVGGRAQAITSTYVRLNLQTVIRSVFQATAYIDYRRQDFDVGAGTRNRADNLFTVGTGLSYSSYITSLRTWTTFSLGYRFLVDDSNRIHDFDVSAVSFMLSFRY